MTTKGIQMTPVQEEVMQWAAEEKVLLTSAQVESLADLITALFDMSIALGAALGPDAARLLAGAIAPKSS